MLLVEVLTNHMATWGPFDKREAAYAISKLGTNGQSAENALLIQANNDNREVRDAVRYALMSVAPRSGVAVLAKDLESKSASVRAEAARLLSINQQVASRVVPLLLRCLEDESERVVRSAVQALGRLRSNSETVVPVLMRHFDMSQGTTDRRLGYLADALGAYGAEAEAALPHLESGAGEIIAFEDAEAILSAIQRIKEAVRIEQERHKNSKE